jgi:amino acid transporter
VLFASIIGFDSIAQAGGEAKNPGRSLPLAIGIAVVGVGLFYMLFTAAVYHAVPWEYVAREAAVRDVTAPGLLGPLLPRAGTVAIIAGAAIALAKDLPAMLFAVSRLMFAWADDGIFPRAVARVHPTRHTPNVAILLSGMMASVGILGSHLAGDFFLGVDLLVTAMLVNFLLICASVLTLPSRNPAIARDVRVLPNRAVQAPLALLGVLVLGGFLAVHTWKDLTAPAAAWYLRSTPVWIFVMTLGSIIYLLETRKATRRGVDLEKVFATLPPE